MREMKDSGIEWVGAIPAAWGVHRIASHFQEIKEKNTANAYSNALQFKMGKIIAKPQKWDEDETNETYSAYTVVHPNTIMINGLNLEFDFVTQRVARVECNGIITSAYIALSPRDDINAEYICYLLKSYDACRAFHSMGRGLRKILSYSELKNKPIVVPPLAEQERIAAFLDAECAEIDAVLEKTRASIEEYKKLKQAVITQAVTKGIRGDRPMKDSGIEWIGEIPAEWSVVPFSKFARVSANLVNPSDYQDYLQVSPENIEKDSGKLLPCKTVSEVGVESWNHFFHKGQILYSKIRPKLNKVCIAPFDGLCSADMYPIDTDNISKFVVYTILSNDFNQQVAMITENRVKMPKINQKELSKIIVVLPADRMEQQEIVDYLDGECGKIDALIAKKQQYLTEIENYKKSLIYEYVTGKKEVKTSVLAD